MAIKRYIPKYKILAKIRQAVWLNKRAKIKKFKKQKWDGKVRLYFPRKPKLFDQDCSVFSVANDFEHDRVTRLKNTYKFLLQDKQVLKLYYGERRLKLYQIKNFAFLAKKLSQSKDFSGGKIFFHLMENRLEVCLYRLGLVRSLMQARKLLASSCTRVNNQLVKNLGFSLSAGSFVQIDSFKSIELLARYLKYNTPFFYFRKRDYRKLFLFERKNFVQQDLLIRERFLLLNFLKCYLMRFKS
jgi:ribosomal protein S4